MKMHQVDKLAWINKLDRAQALLMLIHDQFFNAFDGPDFRKVLDELKNQSDGLKIDYFNHRKECGEG